MNLAGAVLIGGASRRMGRPKAAIEIRGVPMAARVAAALSAAGAAPVVAIGRVDGLESDRALPVIDDRHPGEGPLGGIITALRFHAGVDAVAVLACDLLAPDPEEVRRLASALDDSTDVVVATVEGRDQWTSAIWARRSLGALETAFAAGERAPRSAAGILRVRRLTAVNTAAYADADTPDALPPDAR